jgi:hypothetical protein
MAGIVRRGRITVRGRCRMPAVRDMAAIGDIGRLTIDHRCRRIGLGTAVLATVSRVIVRVVPEDRRAVRTMGIRGTVREARVPGLQEIDRAIPEMEIVREQVLEALEMEIVREVVRVAAVRRSRGRVEDRRRSLVPRRNRAVRQRSLVRVRGQHNLVLRHRLGLHSTAVLVRNLVLRTRAGHSLGPQGGSRRGRGHHRTEGRTASLTRLSVIGRLKMTVMRLDTTRLRPQRDPGSTIRSMWR